MEGIQVSTQVAGSQNQISIIKVGGFIDTTTSAEVERALNSLLKQGRYNVIIDLGNVDYISSAGWGIFISEIKSIREHGGDLKLVRMIPDVYEIFELLEFHHILEVYDSIEEAVQRFETTPGREAVGVAASTQAASATGAAGRTVKGPEPPVSPPVSQSALQTPAPAVAQTVAPKAGAETERPLAERTLEEKIKYIVKQDPDLGAYKINKLLNTEKFGYTKVGWFTVRSLLGQLGLGSRKKRREFASQI
ncbi:MAG: hypothetical protein Kow0037_11680 [Calditrichia bacterium]